MNQYPTASVLVGTLISVVPYRLPRTAVPCPPCAVRCSISSRPSSDQRPAPVAPTTCHPTPRRHTPVRSGQRVRPTPLTGQSPERGPHAPLHAPRLPGKVFNVMAQHSAGNCGVATGSAPAPSRHWGCPDVRVNPPYAPNPQQPTSKPTGGGAGGGSRGTRAHDYPCAAKQQTPPDHYGP